MSNNLLDPLPEPLDWPDGEYTAQDMQAERDRCYALGVAAERERLMADAEKWGNALNEAAWAMDDAYRKYTGQPVPALLFNHGKAILRDAIAAYFKALND